MRNVFPGPVHPVGQFDAIGPRITSGDFIGTIDSDAAVVRLRGTGGAGGTAARDRVEPSAVADLLSTAPAGKGGGGSADTRAAPAAERARAIVGRRGRKASR